MNRCYYSGTAWGLTIILFGPVLLGVFVLWAVCWLTWKLVQRLVRQHGVVRYTP